MSKDDVVELRWIVSVIYRWKWLIFGCTLLATVTAYFVLSRMPPTYRATVTMLVEPARNASSSRVKASSIWPAISHALARRAK